MKRTPTEPDKRAALLLVREERPHPLIGVAFPDKACKRGQFSLTTPTGPIIDRFDCEQAVERLMSTHFCGPAIDVRKLFVGTPPRASTRRKEYHWYLVRVPSGCNCTDLVGFESFTWVGPSQLDHAISHMHDTRQRMVLLAFEEATKLTPGLLDAYQPTLADLSGAIFSPAVRQVVEQSVCRVI